MPEGSPSSLLRSYTLSGEWGDVIEEEECTRKAQQLCEAFACACDTRFTWERAASTVSTGAMWAMKRDRSTMRVASCELLSAKIFCATAGVVEDAATVAVRGERDRAAAATIAKQRIMHEEISHMNIRKKALGS